MKGFRCGASPAHPFMGEPVETMVKALITLPVVFGNRSAC